MILAVTFFGLAAVFAILTGVGTVCVAWNAQIYPPFFALIPLMTFFQYLVYANVAASAFGFALIYPLARGVKRAYFLALITILVFIATAVIQMYYSSNARGIPFLSAAPTNMRLYSTLFVAGYFLFLRIPAIWNNIGLNQDSGYLKYYRTSISIFLILSGAVVLTTSVWASSAHIIDGVNMIGVFEVPLVLWGVASLSMGSFLFLSQNYRISGVSFLIFRRIQYRIYSLFQGRRSSG
jgi:hypothetical protein